MVQETGVKTLNLFQFKEKYSNAIKKIKAQRIEKENAAKEREKNDKRTAEEAMTSKKYTLNGRAEQLLDEWEKIERKREIACKVYKEMEEKAIIQLKKDFLEKLRNGVIKIDTSELTGSVKNACLAGDITKKININGIVDLLGSRGKDIHITDFILHQVYKEAQASLGQPLQQSKLTNSDADTKSKLFKLFFLLREGLDKFMMGRDGEVVVRLDNIDSIIKFIKDFPDIASPNLISVDCGCINLEHKDNLTFLTKGTSIQFVGEEITSAQTKLLNEVADELKKKTKRSQAGGFLVNKGVILKNDENGAIDFTAIPSCKWFNQLENAEMLRVIKTVNINTNDLNGLKEDDLEIARENLNRCFGKNTEKPTILITLAEGQNEIPESLKQLLSFNRNVDAAGKSCDVVYDVKIKLQLGENDTILANLSCLGTERNSFVVLLDNSKDIEALVDYLATLSKEEQEKFCSQKFIAGKNVFITQERFFKIDYEKMNTSQATLCLTDLSQFIKDGENAQVKLYHFNDYGRIQITLTLGEKPLEKLKEWKKPEIQELLTHEKTTVTIKESDISLEVLEEIIELGENPKAKDGKNFKLNLNLVGKQIVITDTSELDDGKRIEFICKKLNDLKTIQRIRYSCNKPLTIKQAKNLGLLVKGVYENAQNSNKQNSSKGDCGEFFALGENVNNISVNCEDYGNNYVTVKLGVDDDGMNDILNRVCKGYDEEFDGGGYVKEAGKKKPPLRREVSFDSSDDSGKIKVALTPTIDPTLKPTYSTKALEQIAGLLSPLSEVTGQRFTKENNSGKNLKTSNRVPLCFILPNKISSELYRDLLGIHIQGKKVVDSNGKSSISSEYNNGTDFIEYKIGDREGGFWYQALPLFMDITQFKCFLECLTQGTSKAKVQYRAIEKIFSSLFSREEGSFGKKYGELSFSLRRLSISVVDGVRLSSAHHRALDLRQYIECKEILFNVKGIEMVTVSEEELKLLNNKNNDVVGWLCNDVSLKKIDVAVTDSWDDGSFEKLFDLMIKIGESREGDNGIEFCFDGHINNIYIPEKYLKDEKNLAIIQKGISKMIPKGTNENVKITIVGEGKKDTSTEVEVSLQELKNINDLSKNLNMCVEFHGGTWKFYNGSDFGETDNDNMITYTVDRHNPKIKLTNCVNKELLEQFDIGVLKNYNSKDTSIGITVSSPKKYDVQFRDIEEFYKFFSKETVAKRHYTIDFEPNHCLDLKDQRTTIKIDTENKKIEIPESLGNENFNKLAEVGGEGGVFKFYSGYTFCIVPSSTTEIEETADKVIKLDESKIGYYKNLFDVANKLKKGEDGKGCDVKFEGQLIFDGKDLSKEEATPFLKLFINKDENGVENIKTPDCYITLRDFDISAFTKDDVPNFNFEFVTLENCKLAPCMVNAKNIHLAILDKSTYLSLRKKVNIADYNKNACAAWKEKAEHILQALKEGCEENDQKCFDPIDEIFNKISGQNGNHESSNILPALYRYIYCYLVELAIPLKGKLVADKKIIDENLKGVRTVLGNNETSFSRNFCSLTENTSVIKKVLKEGIGKLSEKLKEETELLDNLKKQNYKAGRQTVSSMREAQEVLTQMQRINASLDFCCALFSEDSEDSEENDNIKKRAGKLNSIGETAYELVEFSEKIGRVTKMIQDAADEEKPPRFTFVKSTRENRRKVSSALSELQKVFEELKEDIDKKSTLLSFQVDATSEIADILAEKVKLTSVIEKQEEKQGKLKENIEQLSKLTKEARKLNTNKIKGNFENRVNALSSEKKSVFANIIAITIRAVKAVWDKMLEYGIVKGILNASKAIEYAQNAAKQHEAQKLVVMGGGGVSTKKIDEALHQFTFQEKSEKTKRRSVVSNPSREVKETIVDKTNSVFEKIRKELSLAKVNEQDLPRSSASAA